MDAERNEESEVGEGVREGVREGEVRKSNTIHFPCMPFPFVKTKEFPSYTYMYILSVLPFSFFLSFIYMYM